MSSIADPEQFSREWAEAWNNRDVEGVLRHFHDDAVFTSPLAARVVPESGGVIHGKQALRAYWTAALRRVPNLHFVVQSVYVGVNAVVIQYQNQNGIHVSEVLIFDGALVKEGHATYADEAAKPAGPTAS
jgi:ketosteroid isomerase-like protein